MDGGVWLWDLVVSVKTGMEEELISSSLIAKADECGVEYVMLDHNLEMCNNFVACSEGKSQVFGLNVNQLELVDGILMQCDGWSLWSVRHGNLNLNDESFVLGVLEKKEKAKAFLDSNSLATIGKCHLFLNVMEKYFAKEDLEHKEDKFKSPFYPCISKWLICFLLWIMLILEKDTG